MNPVSMLLVIVIGLAAIGLAMWLKRQTAMAAAMDETCLLCDSENVQTRGAAGYACRECGYDTAMELNPAVAPLVDKFRDLKGALTALDRARDSLQAAAGTGVLGGLGSVGPAGLERSALEAQASEHVVEAQGILMRLAGEHPELAGAPNPADRPGSRGAELALDTVFLTSVATKRVEASLEQLLVFIAEVQSVADALAKRILARAGAAPAAASGTGG